MLKKIKKNDFFIYFLSLTSLLFISLLLTSSKSISYNISDEDLIRKNLTSVKKEELRRAYFKNNSDFKSILNSHNNIAQNETKITNVPVIPAEPEIKIESTNNSFQNHPSFFTYEVKKGDFLLKIAKRYNVLLSEIMKYNNIKNPNFIKVGEKIIIPLKNDNDYLANENNSTEQAFKLRKKKLKFTWPLIGRISSEFGVRVYPDGRRMDFHTGIDICTEYGKEFKAAEDGKVIFVGNKGKYGLLIIIQHSNGFKTYYGHCLISLVQVGQYVRKGQIIGRVGESGNATGPHLHFEIRKNDIAVDPANFINKRLLFY